MEYLLMLLSAFGLGAAHALEPGHGKTVVAAYLIGSRGRTLDAIVLGGVVTATHTASVFVLAVASTVAAAYLVPEEVQRALAVGAGLLVVAVGLWMICHRTRGGGPAHSHGHSHHPTDRYGGQELAGHDPHPHPHPHHDGPAVGQHALRLGSLVALGISGGIVPCPAALLLIPAAVGLGTVLKGLLLVVSFSTGLAAVLMAMGILTLRAASLAGRWLERTAWVRRVSIASAYFVTLLGLALTVNALLGPAAGH